MTTWSVATSIRASNAGSVWTQLTTDRDGSSVTLDTACANSPVSIVVDKTALRALSTGNNLNGLFNQQILDLVGDFLDQKLA